MADTSAVNEAVTGAAGRSASATTPFSLADTAMVKIIGSGNTKTENRDISEFTDAVTLANCVDQDFSHRLLTVDDDGVTRGRKEFLLLLPNLQVWSKKSTPGAPAGSEYGGSYLFQYLSQGVSYKLLPRQDWGNKAKVESIERKGKARIAFFSGGSKLFDTGCENLRTRRDRRINGWVTYYRELPLPSLDEGGLLRIVVEPNCDGWTGPVYVGLDLKCLPNDGYNSRGDDGVNRVDAPLNCSNPICDPDKKLFVTQCIAPFISIGGITDGGLTPYYHCATSEDSAHDWRYGLMKQKGIVCSGADYSRKQCRD
ncbi:MAG: hypothetical protein VW771_06660 [Gammaproteobacteria bacterium]